MALVPITAAQIATMFQPDMNTVFPGVSGGAITAGQIVYLHTSGDWRAASAAAAGTAGFVGVALESVGGAGQAVSVLTRGAISGLTLTALDYGAPIYLGDAAGTFDTAAGTVSKIVGNVLSIPRANGVSKVALIGVN
jgi:hypothetical protein